MKRLKGAGVFVMGTATNDVEAKILADAGCDAVIAQGLEAGGHRGTFSGMFTTGMVPVRTLVERCRDATPLPVVAAGGLMTGGDIVEVIRRGAVAGMLGTAFLVCPESGATAAYKRAIMEAKGDPTEFTRAFSGRPAQGLRNGFIERTYGNGVGPYPLQNLMTRPMRTEAARQGKADYMSLWAGRGVTRVRAMPAGELVRVLVEEMGGGR